MLKSKTLLALLLTFLIVGCGSNDSTDFVVTGNNPTLTALQITAPNQNPTLAKGTTLQLTAAGVFNSRNQGLPSLSWTSSNTSVATVNDTGLVTGVAPGTATITARASNGATGTINLTVTDAVVQSIAIQETTALTVQDTQELQLQLVATFTDNTTQNVTDLAAWSSSNEATATVTTTTPPRGLVTGVEVGTVNITASFGGLSDSATVNVTAAPAPPVIGVDQLGLFAFQSPATNTNSVFVLTTNHFAGGTGASTFVTGAEYFFVIDTNGDAQGDILYLVKFGTANGQGQQAVTVTRRQNATDTVVASGTTNANLAVQGGGQFRAGVFADPTFVDLAGFNNGFNFTGTNSFAVSNSLALVLEIPSASLGTNNIGVFARLSFNGQQLSRVGRPFINTLLIPAASKAAYALGLPVNDVANFRTAVVNSLISLGNTNSSALADILLPDLLTIDTSNAAGFLNGRRLTDDVFDAELSLFTNGAITTDMVNTGPGSSNSFPYLVAPNVI